MRRLLILTALAVVTVSTTGCGGLLGWSRRGASCDVCNGGGTPYGATYSPDYNEGEMILPGPPATLPGPMRAN